MSQSEVSAVLISLQVATLAVVTSFPFAVGIAYVLARKTFPGRWLLQGFVDLPLVLPPVVTGFLLLGLFSSNSPVGRVLNQMGLAVAFSWLGAVLAAGVVSFPLMVRSIKGSFQNSNARLELAARSLGASRISAFVTITLPLARNGIIAGCLLAFARAMGEFGATVMLAGNIPDQTRTIPLAIYSMSQRVGGFEQSWRLVLISVLIALVAVGIGEYLENRRRNIEQN